MQQKKRGGQFRGNLKGNKENLICLARFVEEKKKENLKSTILALFGLFSLKYVSVQLPISFWLLWCAKKKEGHFLVEPRD